MKLLFGKRVAQKILSRLDKEIEELKKRGKVPLLGVVIVGDKPFSRIYLGVKKKTAQKIGIKLKIISLKVSIGTQGVIKKIEELNKDNSITGIIVQFPLPRSLDAEKILSAIIPEKDVEGFHFKNILPPTPRAILEILKFYKISLKGKKVVLIGRGRLVGRPLERILVDRGINLFSIDKDTQNPSKIAQKGDILIVGTGVPGLVKENWVKKGAVIIDCGFPKSEVDFKALKDKVSASSPVPGGVGPVTVASLFDNVVRLACEEKQKR